MAKILDGKKLSLLKGEELKKRILSLDKQPTLLIIQVGDKKESNTYIKHKKDFAKFVGAEIIHKIYPESVTKDELVRDIEIFNIDPSINGIIVQLPIPASLNSNSIINKIAAKKDVDGQTSNSLKKLVDNEPGFIPATTRGIMTLLDYYGLELSGKKVVILGRSTLVGKPTALAFMNKNATVTVCHSKTENLKEETKRADILIVAIGKPEFIKKDFVREDQVVIDVGINFIKTNGQNKLVGDVDFEEVKQVVSYITPVPGGVGPMTVLSLFLNLFDASR